MARFLITVPHPPETLACARVVDIFLKTGSHWVTNADWGCKDGDHTAWLIVDADDKDEARQILPAAFRADARIVRLNKFMKDEIETVLREHRRQG